MRPLDLSHRIAALPIAKIEQRHATFGIHGGKWMALAAVRRVSVPVQAAAQAASLQQAAVRVQQQRQWGEARVAVPVWGATGPAVRVQQPAAS